MNASLQRRRTMLEVAGARVDTARALLGQGSDDAVAREILTAIRDLALALYPFDRSTDMPASRLAALGILGGSAQRALDGEPLTALGPPPVQPTEDGRQ